MVRSLLFTLAAFLCASWLAFVGVVSTGMGHGRKNTTDLWLMLAVSPWGAGFLFWIVIGFLLSRPASRSNKTIVACLLSAHYAGLIYYLCTGGAAEVRSLLPPSERDFGAWVLFGLPYLAGQIYILAYLLRRQRVR